MPGLKAGFKAGMSELENFLKKRLPKYSTDRNNPIKDGLSKLSPWLHFGKNRYICYILICIILLKIKIVIIFRSDISSKMYLRS